MHRAINAVTRAKARGHLPSLTGEIACVDCGAPATDYDHRDYNRPLDVDPVCRRCNVRRGPALDVDPPIPFLAPRSPECLRCGADVSAMHHLTRYCLPCKPKRERELARYRNTRGTR